MLSIRQEIKFFRKRIPVFECVKNCHDCCGPVTTSSFEISMLPLKTDAEHESALAELSCPYLGKNGCEVYDERPLICRLFGTTQKLPCPHGRGPEQMLAPQVEMDIQNFFLSNRQVLL